mgnify:FL=1
MKKSAVPISEADINEAKAFLNRGQNPETRRTTIIAIAPIITSDATVDHAAPVAPNLGIVIMYKIIAMMAVNKNAGKIIFCFIVEC